MQTMKKCATITIIGRPSSGKSTFLNSICEAKVSITSPIPQTTRNAIKGIYTDERGQLIFVDTPGIHQSEAHVNQMLKDLAVSSMSDCDGILYMIDSTRETGAEENLIVSLLAKTSTPVVICINKKDLATPEQLQSKLDFVKANLPAAPVSTASALEDDGLDEVLIALFKLAPEGELLYGEDAYTDQDLEFRVSEIIREKAMTGMREEVPHSLFVEVSDLQYNEETSKVWIRAFIVVEHESQKGIVIGKGGENIKRIRVESFKDLKKVFPGSKLEIDLRVKTLTSWRQNDGLLRKLIK